MIARIACVFPGDSQLSQFTMASLSNFDFSVTVAVKILKIEESIVRG